MSDASLTTWTAFTDVQQLAVVWTHVSTNTNPCLVITARSPPRSTIALQGMSVFSQIGMLKAESSVSLRAGIVIEHSPVALWLTSPASLICQLGQKLSTRIGGVWRILPRLASLICFPFVNRDSDTSQSIQLEAATKKRRGGRPSAAQTAPEPWIDRTLAIFSPVDTQAAASKPRTTTPIPVSNRTLRSKLKGSGIDSPSVGPSPVASPSVPRGKTQAFNPRNSTSSSDTDSSATADEVSAEALSTTKKLPKVILKLGPKPSVA